MRKKPSAGEKGKSGGGDKKKQGRASEHGKKCVRADSSDAKLQNVRSFEAFMNEH